LSKLKEESIINLKKRNAEILPNLIEEKEELFLDQGREFC
jgi:hypothetical protein